MKKALSFAFFLFLGMLISVAQNNVNQNVKTQKETQAQHVRPQFPGGNNALVSFLSKNIRYPEQARKDKVAGKVVVMFVVEADGRITGARVAQSLSPECDKEAVRVVNLMPKWSPAYQNGKPVRCFYQIPIVFNLN